MFDSAGTRTWIDFIGPTVRSVVVNGAPSPVHYDGARILLDGLAASNTVTIVADGAYSRSGEGLHRFVDPVDDETYLYTHYEPADARRVFACFEQPDMKAPYVFTVRAPDGWEVLSNQPVASDQHDASDQPGAGRIVTFAPTPLISTYITAVIAGPYHRAEAEYRARRPRHPARRVLPPLARTVPRRR